MARTSADDTRSPGPGDSLSVPAAEKSDPSLATSAIEFAQQAERLSYQKPEDGATGEAAVEAQFVTPQDPIIVTADGDRLPAVPLAEARKLNDLKAGLQSGGTASGIGGGEASQGDAINRASAAPGYRRYLSHHFRSHGKLPQNSAEGDLRQAMPPSHTNPLFPPLPLYGPPSILRSIQCRVFRVSSFFLSISFLGVIVLGSLFTSIPPICRSGWYRITGRDPDASRPFYEEEIRRKQIRKSEQGAWKRQRSQDAVSQAEERCGSDGFVPTEGGPDPVKCDVGYYARRVGLDVEEFEVQTEDGFIIALWHVFDPREYTKLPEQDRRDRGPELFTDAAKREPWSKEDGKRRKFPVLLMHGLLQSAGAYCVNDDDSLAFFLCKSGYDVWLGNNRCGFEPKHVLLNYSDPRMWCWNIRQMGVFDLTALTSRVLYETGFEKIGLVCHSQGTTQTFVALAKEQRPDLGEKITVFCALAPAAYAGPLIGKMYFKFMRVISPAMFRLMFGIHAFIPLMMSMHSMLHPHIYGWLGYKVFSFLFNWTDQRWDRGLRDRMFQFAPVYVSAESMRWWLGRECFARHKCILSTKEEWRAEEREDDENNGDGKTAVGTSQGGLDVEKSGDTPAIVRAKRPKGATAWYNEQAPPFALWVCGRDALVDGEKLIRRFANGREPHVNVVHSKVIPEFEHLDVIWAMDAVDQVFKEIREVLWKTCDARDACRVPLGCEDVPQWALPVKEEEVATGDEQVQSSSSNEDLTSGL